MRYKVITQITTDVISSDNAFIDGITGGTGTFNHLSVNDITFIGHTGSTNPCK